MMMIISKMIRSDIENNDWNLATPPAASQEYLVISGRRGTWPWDGHYKSILLPADKEIIIGSL
jgi:hypothetical protein